MQIILQLFLIGSLLITTTSSPIVFSSSALDENIDNIDFWKSFLSFQKRFNKIYPSETELQQRFEIFKENVITIFQHNLEKKENYTMGINQFTDLTSVEFQKNVIRGGFIGTTASSLRGKSKCSQYSYQQLKVPSSIDWRDFRRSHPSKRPRTMRLMLVLFSNRCDGGCVVNPYWKSCEFIRGTIGGLLKEIRQFRL